MSDITIVYYTANKDYPTVEENLRAVIEKNSGGLPVVSVSQERIDFGTNICIGPIGRSRPHIFLQMRIGVEIARTTFVALCEADTLYPPQFFQFQPEREDTYYFPQDGYISWLSNKMMYFPKGLHITGFIARKHLLKLLDVMQVWAGDTGFRLNRDLCKLSLIERVDMGPVVTLKTGLGMNHKSPHSNQGRTRVLPVWGHASEMWAMCFR